MRGHTLYLSPYAPLVTSVFRRFRKGPRDCSRAAGKNRRLWAVAALCGAVASASCVSILPGVQSVCTTKQETIRQCEVRK